MNRKKPVILWILLFAAVVICIVLAFSMVREEAVGKDRMPNAQSEGTWRYV